MGLYSKKLHIKKQNGAIQIVNLYTDKSDVGNNYLTFRDGGNTIYSILDVNGDIDCKISKNNISYKIKNMNFTIPNYKIIQPNGYFTVPNGVNVIFVIFGWDTDYLLSAEEFLKEQLKTSVGYYIKVTPNKTYSAYCGYTQSKETMSDYIEYHRIGNFYEKTIYGNVVSSDPDYYDDYDLKTIVAWSSEINSHAINGSAD